MYSKNPEYVHILVVDDDELIRKMLQRAIQKEGYACSVASDPQQALKLLEAMTVDVVITDIIMPGLDGIELTQIVKKNYNCDVIVMTNFAEDVRYEEVVEKGGSDFIEKPLDINETLVRIHRVLREREILAQRDRAAGELQASVIKLKRVLEETVNALGSALEKRDVYTSGHQYRVSKLACSIAQEMDMPEDAIEGIRIAGLLHDIGKISVPADILNKPGRLSEHEFNIIREHPRVGYEILTDIEFDYPVAQIILQHHERMDGSGYPQRLEGEKIITEARVLIVSDVVEAMASHRPYRPTLGQEAALEEINHNQGQCYDAEVVQACLKIFREGVFQFEFDNGNPFDNEGSWHHVRELQ